MGDFIKKKSLGQNFLKDESVLSEIIDAGELSSGDNVLEIGPGEGALTSRLLEKVGKVVAIEKDERMKDKNSVLQKICNKGLFPNTDFRQNPSGLPSACQKKSANTPYLHTFFDGALNKTGKFSSKTVLGNSPSKPCLLQNRLKIYFDDVLKVNLPEILRENNFDKKGYKVVANIPYYITGKIIRLLFEQEFKPELMVLLVQKEVAERIIAKKGRQSILSLSVQFFAKPEIVAEVSREAFEPAPKVDSAILKIRPYRLEDKIYLNNKALEKDFFHLIKIGFASPRKTLINNLKNGLEFTREEIKGVFQKLNLPENIRAEKLLIQQWLDLVKELK